MQDKSGFTLVELAIVITIIGLLIGGVLKGQELLQNARMTSFQSQVKAVDTAVITFRDVYKALPGDMLNPGNFLQNCTTTNCNTSGNADFQIVGKSEVNSFWIHLAAANLVSGVKSDVNWSSSSEHYASVSPPTPFGGQLGVNYDDFPIQTDWPEGLHGHHLTALVSAATGILPINTIAKLDLKMDNGKPRTGMIMTSNGLSGCNPAVYDPNVSTACNFIVMNGF